MCARLFEMKEREKNADPNINGPKLHRFICKSLCQYNVVCGRTCTLHVNISAQAGIKSRFISDRGFIQNAFAVALNDYVYHWTREFAYWNSLRFF